MKIKAAIERMPGGMMMVPLAAGALLATFAPRLLTFFGSFTSALFAGALPLLGAFYVCVGATIPIGSLPTIMKRGGALMLTKISLGVLAGLVLGHFLGIHPVTSGWFAGLSTLAVVAAVNDTNGGLYMALMRRYGTGEDVAAYSAMALESGPFLTMVSLGVAGLSAFPWQTLLGAVLPLIVGMILGNLDLEMREFLAPGVPILIPFFALGLGTSLDLHRVWAAGLLGLLIGVSVAFASSVALGSVDLFTGGNGTAGIAASATAGNAAAVPMLVAAANPAYAAAAPSATVLVAASVVITSLLTPTLTALWHRRISRSLEAKL